MTNGTTLVVAGIQVLSDTLAKVYKDRRPAVKKLSVPSLVYDKKFKEV